MRLMSYPTSPTRCLVTRSSTLLSGLRHRGNASSLRRLDHARKFREVAELVAGEGEDTGYNPTTAALAVLAGIAASDAACCTIPQVGLRASAPKVRAGR